MGEVREYEFFEGKKVKLGTNMEESVCQEVLLVLKEKENSFARSLEDIQVVNPKIMTHRLNMDPSMKPIK